MDEHRLPQIHIVQRVERDGRTFSEPVTSPVLRPKKPMAMRFWPKVEIGDLQACWLWQGALYSNGYGHISAGRRGEGHLLAHRVAYQLLVGPIPEGHDLDHECRNRACVNPVHLDPVTRSENLKRGVGVGGLRNQRRDPQTGRFS